MLSTSRNLGWGVARGFVRICREKIRAVKHFLLTMYHLVGYQISVFGRCIWCKWYTKKMSLFCHSATMVVNHFLGSADLVQRGNVADQLGPNPTLLFPSCVMLERLANLSGLHILHL